MELVEAVPAFRRFLATATRLRRASPDRQEQFNTFLAKAKPLLVKPTRRRWEALTPQLAILQSWFVAHDLLAKIAHLEDSYTELIRWALEPATHPPSAELRQSSWLASLGIDWRNARPAEPCTQFWTSDGVPDLVLSFAPQTVVVEVKTWSNEHLVPSGKTQTIAYPDAVRSALRLSSQHPIHIVFLTPDRHAADNPEAICTSFAHFALVLAGTLADIDLADDLRFAFAMLITHLATFGLPLMTQAVGWHRELNDDLLLRHIREISVMTKLLLERNNV